ncbi:MAG TPA: hypothetical protein VGR90_00645 [Acidimicrobiales bacterium]|nr:hypothetical protein [Acidimicrobiales bacterium]
MARQAPSRQSARADARRAERRAAERDRRQQERLRRAERSRRVTRRRRQTRWLAVRVAIGIVVAFAAVVWSGPDEPVHEPRIGAPVTLPAYAVTYAVTYTGGVHNVEKITVQRPYNGMDVTYRNGQIVAGEMTNSQGLWEWSTNNTPGWLLLSQGVQRSVSDVQPVLALDAGVDQNAVAVVGAGRALGRPCTMVVTGQPVGQPVQAPDPSSLTRMCLDRTGIPLTMLWTLDGKTAETMTATAFDVNPSVTPATFAADPLVQSPTGHPPVQSVALTPQQRAELHPTLDPPAGYGLADAYISFQQDAQTGLPTFTSKEIYVDRVRGQLLELDYNGHAASTKGATVPVAGGRTGYLSLDLYASSLEVPVNEGASLAMFSPDPSLLRQAALRLRF